MSLPSADARTSRNGQFQPHAHVSSYDDLLVSSGATAELSLTCPECGFITLPQGRRTLGDLTNAGMQHLSEQHQYSLTLPSPRSMTTETRQRRQKVRPDDEPTDAMWSLVALLGEDADGLEDLVWALAAQRKKDILAFHRQLTAAVAQLGTPAHRGQRVLNSDDPLQTVPTAMSDDVFATVALAVVASGRETWLHVVAEPSRLATGWSLRAGQALLDAPTAALNHITHAASPKDGGGS